MKHLKHFENISLDLDKMLQLNTYWKFKNNVQDSIFKTIGKHNDWVYFEILLITKKDKPYNKIIKLDFSVRKLTHIVKNNIIFREATKKEIGNFEEQLEIYNMTTQTKKYNI